MKKTTYSLSLFQLPIFCFLLLPCLVLSATSFKSVVFLLNCGESFDALDADKRRWTNDSTIFAPSNLQSSFSAQASKADLYGVPSPIPYQSARIFTSISSYIFNALPSARHFVRLHFLPSVYNDRDTKNAFFSVTTGPYTLLSNFSPAITSKALNQSYVVREFFITVPSSGSLILTFTPSKSTLDFFAFVNGIEIVSSPELFIFAFHFLANQRFPIRDSDALQTVVRLNVGGNYVSPTSDSGLSRTWYDDSPYIFGAGFGVSYERDPNVSIRYSNAVPEYTAPSEVYGTARSMGPSAIVNLNYNLTWFVTVDNGFRYLIRLHFCEIQSQVYKTNQRVFNVYVNNMTADPELDVIFYAQQNVGEAPIYTGVAVYRNYMVLVPPSSDKQSNLRIDLHPDVDTKRSYEDAILNGLEVFKVNESSGNLAGPNPDLPPAPAPENSSPIGRHGGGHSLAIAGAVGGIAAMLVVGACIYCMLCRFQRKKKEKGSDGSGSVWLPLSPYALVKRGKSTAFSAEKSNAIQCNDASSVYCRHFMLSEIIAATNNFDDAFLLGVGGFGKVYKGEIDSGTKVAIKRGNQLSEQGEREFKNEIEMLSKLRHRHLVSLIGYCDDSSEMILVYNYMAHGTLRQHLYGINEPPLSWRQRLEICIGAAKGLHYLHAGATYTLIHRDVKTTNILLDENWVAKVSDFGLSRMGSSMDCSHVSTGVKGTFGYFDPEYFRLQRLTEKSDVYSFGVVMLEVLCARPVIDMSRPMEEISLAEWALHSIREGRTEQIIDGFLEGMIAPECLLRFIENVQKCLAEKSAERPSMANVVSSLELALALQICAEEGNTKAEGLASRCFLDLYGDEYDDAASMSSTPCQTDEDRSRSTVDAKAIYEIN